MKSITTSAKTREEAIRIALEELGVERHEVDVEILDGGSNGFLGLGARDVKVRVTAQGVPDEDEEPERAAPPQQPRRRGKRPRRGQEHHVEPRRPDQRERPGRPEHRERPERPEHRERPKRPEHRERPERPEPPEQAEKRVPDIVRPVSGEGEVSAASALLEEMIHHMGIEASVRSFAMTEDNTLLVVDSEDPALLIGRKGRNLEAMQYLINRMVRNGDESGDSERITVDVAGYLDRRKASLEEMALRLAARAKETGRRVRVKPLSPQERRIIHLTLQDDPDVRTFSVGSSSVRCVIIAPKEERAGHRGGWHRSGPRGDSRPPRSQNDLAESSLDSGGDEHHEP